MVYAFSQPITGKVLQSLERLVAESYEKNRRKVPLCALISVQDKILAQREKVGW